MLNAEAALFALEHADEYARQAATIRAERERLMRALHELPGVRPFTSEANMILARFAGCSGDLRAAEAAPRPRQERLGVCIRCWRTACALTIGTPDEVTLMIDALKAST